MSLSGENPVVRPYAKALLDSEKEWTVGDVATGMDVKHTWLRVKSQSQRLHLPGESVYITSSSTPVVSHDPFCLIAFMEQGRKGRTAGKRHSPVVARGWGWESGLRQRSLRRCLVHLYLDCGDGCTIVRLEVYTKECALNCV